MKFKRRISLVLTATLVVGSMFKTFPTYAFSNEKLFNISNNTDELFDVNDKDLLANEEENTIDNSLIFNDKTEQKEDCEVSHTYLFQEETISYNSYNDIEEKDKNEVIIGEFTYRIDDDNLTATVMGWSGKGKAVIPSNIKLPENTSHYTSVGLERRVNAIGEKAFENNSELTAIEFSDTIVIIEANAFSGCVSLTSVEFPANMEKICQEAFSGCTKLNSVKLPNKIKDMGWSIFKGCTSLKSITIPKDMDLQLDLEKMKRGEIPLGPFSETNNLTEIYFENDIKKIPDGLFYKCDSIKSISLPSPMTTVGEMSFEGCQNLKEIKMAETLIEFKERSFKDCPKIHIIDFSPNMKWIRKEAFLNCIGLSENRIPDNIREIGENAFRECVNLENVTFYSGDNVGYEGGEIQNAAFYNCESIKSINIPNSIVYIGKYAFFNCCSAKDIILDGRIAGFDHEISIDEFAFSECKSAFDLKLCNNIVFIGNGAFFDCKKIPKVIMPDTVREVWSSAFEYCENLSEVKLSKSLKIFGEAVFRFDTSLTGITIPKSLETVNLDTNQPHMNGIFYGCERFKNIEFEAGIITIPAKLFRGATSVEKVIIPSTVTAIGDYAFDNCNHIKELTIPNSVISIGDHSFNSCKWLEGANVIPGSVKTIGNYAFCECVQLESLKLTGEVERIGEYAFKDCTGIKTATIPDTAELCKGAFMGCTKLSNAHLPVGLAVVPNELFSGCTSLSVVNLSTEKLTSIGEFAFYNCDSLKTFDNTEALDLREYKKLGKIDKNAFQDCDSIKTLLLPAATTELGEFAFDDCNMLSSISLGTGLATIPNGAFSNLSSLTDMIIPRQVKTIKAGAFRNDTALKKIHIPKTTETIEDNVFSTYKILTICGTEPSPAYTYAKDRNISWNTETVYVKSMKFVENKVEVNEGASIEPVLEITPVHYSVDVEYISENPEVFTVEIKEDKCVINGVSKGDANLVARAYADETGKYTQATIPVRVRRPVRGVGITPGDITLGVGTNAQLTANVDPADATNPDVVWSSEDEKIAYVSQKGVVYAKTKGTVVILATSKDNKDIVGRCNVTVTSEIKDAPESWSKVLDKPMADPAGGNLTRGTTVMLSSVAAGSSIYYTTNGSEPVADYEGRIAGDTKLYTGPISINKNMTLKAFAICPGYKYSPVVEFTYSVDDGWGDIDASLRGRFGNNTGAVPDGMWFAFKDDEKIYQEGKDTAVVKVYTGEKITFNSEVYVFNGFSRLIENRDYKLTFKNNTEPASFGDKKVPYVTVKGKGNYKGKSEFRFTITKVDLKSVVITPGTDLVILAGKPINTVGISAVYNGSELKSGDDYTIIYYKGSVTDTNKINGDDITVEGTSYYAVLTAVSNSKYYTGDRNVTIKAVKGSVPMSEVSAPSDAAVGWSKDLVVKKLFDNTSGSAPILLTYNNTNLKYGTDFTVADIDKNAYPDYPDAGSYSVVVKGAGTSYVGTKTVRFKINGVDKADVIVNGLNNKPVYTGSIITRNDLGAFTLENKATGAKLVEGTDYVVDMSKAVSNGKFEVLFKLKGGYQGIKKVNVRVVKADLSGISDSDVKVGKAVYSKAGTKPAVSVTYKGKILREGVDYTLTYSNNKNASSGKSPMVNLKGKGCFKGKKSVAFSIEKSSIARLSLSVADVKFTAGKTGSYYKKVPKVMDGEKAVSKKKDVTTFNKTNCVFTNAITGTVIGDKDPIEVGTIIKVQLTLSGGTNGIYEGKDVVLTGNYKVIDPTKDIKKAKIKDIEEANYRGGDDVVLAKGTDFKVYLGDSETPLDPKFYEIVSISNRNLIGKSTVTIRGVGEYGGLKKFKIKIKAKQF